MDRSSKFQFVGARYNFLLRIIDIGIIYCALLIIMHGYNITFNKDYLLVLSGVLFFYSYIGESLGLYRSWRLGRFSTMSWLIFFNVTIAFLLMTLVLFLFKYSEVYSRFTMAAWYFLSVFALVSWRYCVREVKRVRRLKGYSVQKIAIVGLTETGKNLYDEIIKHDELGFECVGFFDDREPSRIENLDASLLTGSINDAVELARTGEIQKLYVCLPMLAEKRIAGIILTLGDSTVDVLITPDFLLKNLMHAHIGSVGEVDTISVFESPVHGMKRFYKRSFDLAFSICAIIVISPVLIAVAIAVYMSSPGTILFKQDRYGLDGRKIKVWKFRSMTVTENDETVTQARKGDVRITRVGAFIRKTSLDELPQFFNVLRGEMSVVGPRPHAVSHNEEYRKLVSYYMLRHKVLPGITGWAQVNGWRGETDTLEKMEKRVEFDLAYIRNWSLWWDVRIVFLTFFTGFVGKNVY
ncbi:MAG: undecaprenyl-phosphate glucose phosphotransferase [Shewanella psychromarinicola]|jgi:putative colanic acid biosynthesis UDP-glucose lipid carrier transferase|uniref:undecaprenyl-phosphate glucose phosphotransferase n=1 Tax=Shewanella TaxID=22 RepID=UPI000C3394EE|nr:undecaprenyl-phosphate glucose phosphotransferase [Shewanella sp. Actino-trap-3]PKG78071.1 undecaprenyl-phosphate glucose phosphotransferase [Shewanella sp. Actino-trap-3]|tara:strand:+ start:167053 stop:168453 length:1401 start_codon:yes stop_codon:yes gene_type:complete